MRAAPSLQVMVTRFGVWRAGVRLTGATAATIALTWAGWHGLTRGFVSAAPMLALGAVVALASWLLAARLAATRSFALGWDGRSWQLGSPSAPATDPIVGEVQVAVDAGSWLLLRFDSSWPPTERRRRYWLPLQRRGLEPSWHGLRCAVYSPRPAVLPAAAPDPAG